MSAREKVVEVLAAHGPSGFVNSREGWVECECEKRLPCQLDRDGYALDWDEERKVRDTHLADALIEAGLIGGTR